MPGLVNDLRNAIFEYGYTRELAGIERAYGNTTSDGRATLATTVLFDLLDDLEREWQRLHADIEQLRVGRPEGV
jgi:hypothetical protein